MNINLPHSAAFALFADGMRTSSPFTRFELFYRVLEYFFPNPQNRAPAHLRRFPILKGKSQQDIRAMVKHWSDLRHDCVHQRPARAWAAHRDDVRALRRVRSGERDMRALAYWLLHNPPL